MIIRIVTTMTTVVVNVILVIHIMPGIVPYTYKFI